VRFPGCTNPVTYQEAPGREAGDAGAAGTLGWCWQAGPQIKGVALSGDPDAIENLTLLCGVHHPIVDRNPRIYSVEVLAKFKADHEAKMAPKDLRVPSPQPATETVDLLLLPVTSLPARVWTAQSLFRTTEEVAAHLPRPRGTQVLSLV
jgi:hypothetical protein